MERWRDAYREAPDVFDALSRAEDPDGRLADEVQRLGDLAGRDVVEIGCGTGHHSRRLAPAARHWLALDPAPALVRLARRRLADVHGCTVIRGRGEAMPLTDEAVDAVVATWVLAYLPRRLRAAVLAEALRVLRPGGAVWLIENHWQSEFQELRGKTDEQARSEVAPLFDAGFRIVATVTTEIAFPSADEACRVLGWICGDEARRRLEERPRRRIGHRAVVLRGDASTLGIP